MFRVFKYRLFKVNSQTILAGVFFQIKWELSKPLTSFPMTSISELFVKTNSTQNVNSVAKFLKKDNVVFTCKIVICFLVYKKIFKTILTLNEPDEE